MESYPRLASHSPLPGQRTILGEQPTCWFHLGLGESGGAHIERREGYVQAS